jgi:hypothetical protein
MLGRLRSFFDPGEQSTRHESDSPSIVLLLHNPLLPTREVTLEMARKAWGAAGPVNVVGTVGPHSYAVRVDTLHFAIHAAPSPYAVDPGNQAQVTDAAWKQHSAWLSIDMPNRKVSKLRESGHLADAYASLLHFVAAHWSPNILGMYFPSQRVTVPNLGDLIESVRWAGRNGTDLKFLKKMK